MPIQIIPITGLPIIKEGDDLAELTVKSLKEQGLLPIEKDVYVFSHVIASRVEGKQVDLEKVEPSQKAEKYAEITGKDPRLLQVILDESRVVRRIGPGVIITETKHGFVCANAGVDKSNVPGETIVSPLPDDPDITARNIRTRFNELAGVNVGVIICDTHGRAHRDGEINVTVGASGFEVIRDRRGEFDLFGYELKVKRTTVSDELSSAAELVIGQSDEGVPAALIRGYDIVLSESGSAQDIVRGREKDLFL
ncbi:MAG: coenzyme F420-0:L-glutamate ligase [Candidatus Bathyarchaeota archaeon]|nr:coenzyme F420-0:L-glutamate ligase [Candidatus Bathyarchaeota archaeon]